MSKTKPAPEISAHHHKPDLGDFRLTPQRREVFDVLMSRNDHPSASEVFMTVKDRMPSISLATVYNCLETLSQCGLVKQVNMDREPSRYCANLNEHAHFFCQRCGHVTDIDMESENGLEGVFELPEGSQVERYHVTIKGICPTCAAEPSSITTQ